MLRLHLDSFEAGIGFMMYSASLVRLEEYDEAHRWGQLAVTILEKYRSRQLDAKVNYLFWSSVQVIKEPIRSIQKPLWNAYRAGMKSGDIEVSTRLKTFEFFSEGSSNVHCFF